MKATNMHVIDELKSSSCFPQEFSIFALLVKNLIQSQV